MGIGTIRRHRHNGPGPAASQATVRSLITIEEHREALREAEARVRSSMRAELAAELHAQAEAHAEELRLVAAGHAAELEVLTAPPVTVPDTQGDGDTKRARARR
jgi:hypothetical protein